MLLATVLAQSKLRLAPADSAALVSESSHPSVDPTAPEVNSAHLPRAGVGRRLAVAVGGAGIAASIGFLGGTLWSDDLLTVSFLLGAFSVALLVGVVSFLALRFGMEGSGSTSVNGRWSRSGPDSEANVSTGPGVFTTHFRFMFDRAPVPMLELDASGRVLRMNQRGAEWLQPAGPNPADEAGTDNTQPRTSFFDALPGSERDAVTEALNRAGGGDSVEIKHQFLVGGRVKVLCTRLVALGSAWSGQARLLAVLDDVTEAEQLALEASSDSLTGLVNRREFEQRLERVLATARADGSEHALCYLDLDEFKHINDSCGHRAGDELLRQLAAKLKGRVRRRDTLARLGGDEFGVLMERCSQPQAVRVAQSLLQAVTDFRFAWADNTFSVGVSIGVVAITPDAGDVDAVVAAADNACYQAKQTGRSRVQVASADRPGTSLRVSDQAVVDEIRVALRDDRFELWGQLIRSPDSGKPEAQSPPRGYEVYLRMRSQTGELLPAGAFLPTAQRYGLGTHIDRWVVRRLMDRENQSGDPPTWFINLSTDSLIGPEFIDDVGRMVRAREYPAAGLCFELRETDVLAHMSDAARFADRARAIGCSLSLEGVGGSPTSLLYLRSLRPDYLKVDGVLVRRLCDEPMHRIVVTAAVELAHAMERQAVAEQIEDQATLELIRGLGVDLVQGNYLSPPAPLD